jgi:predicted aconitase with swiveling domain
LKKEFKGRSVLPDEIEGEAVVTHTGFNTLACYYKSILSNATRAICGDQGNPDIFGRDLTDKIICLPKSIGSTSAGATWDRIAKMGLAPRAMLFSQHIDSLSAAGLALVEVWGDKRICAVDQLGDEFLNWVETGQKIRIKPDGVVTVG